MWGYTPEIIEMGIDRTLLQSRRNCKSHENYGKLSKLWKKRKSQETKRIPRLKKAISIYFIA